MPIEELDSNQFTEVNPVSTQEIQAQAPEELGSEFTEMPQYADGLTPQTAINKSPIDLVDRLRYSLGNKAGVEKDLRSKFEDVTQDAKGNYMVKKEGSWYRADAKGLGDGDAWERTKELIGDTADIGPQVLKNAAIGYAFGSKGGARMGLAAAATGALATIGTDAYSEEINQLMADHPYLTGAAGAGILGTAIAGMKTAGAAAIKKNWLPLAVGMGAEAARTSMGRLVGTYDMTDKPWEQMQDIGVEGLLNLGGVYMEAGVKPTAQFAANSVRKLGNALSDMPKTSLELAKLVHGPLSGVGADNIENLAVNTSAVTGHFNRAVQSAPNAEGAVATLIKEQVGETRKLIEEIQPALSRQYVSMSEDAVKSVEPEFIGSSKEHVQSLWQKAAGMGLGKLHLSSEGKILGFNASNDQQLAASAARLLQTGRHDEAEMVQGLIGNKDAKRYVQSFFSTVNAHARSPDQKGELGARALVGFKKAINNRIGDLKSQAIQNGAASTKKLLDVLDNHLDSSIMSRFQPKDGSPNKFQMFNDAYSKLKQTVQPLLDARDSSITSHSEQPYLNLLNAVTNNTRTGILKQDAFHRLASLTNPKTGKAVFSQNVADIYQGILNRETAKSFIPRLRPGALGKYGPVGLLSIAATNPALAVKTAPILAATSPRATGRMVQIEQASAKWLQGHADAGRAYVEKAVKQVGSYDAVKTMTDVGFKGLEFTQKLAATGKIKDFVKNEDMMKTFFSTLMNGFSGTYSTRDKLMQQVK